MREVGEWRAEARRGMLSRGGGLVLCGRAAGVGAGGEAEWSWRAGP
jgi:hypothetical protein